MKKKNCRWGHSVWSVPVITECSHTYAAHTEMINVKEQKKKTMLNGVSERWWEEGQHQSDEDMTDG